jgi:hypothetical protein
MKVVHVNIVCLEPAGMPVHPIQFDTHITQQLDEQVDVKDVRDVLDGDFFRREENGADDLQGLVLRPLGHDIAFELAAACNYE